MAIRFRKSIKLGGARINVSKSGVGYSVGGKGFRYTKKANGSTKTTASLPGTGISYIKEYGRKSRSHSSIQNGAQMEVNYKVFAVIFKIVAILIIVLSAVLVLVKPGIGLVGIVFGILFWVIGNLCRKKSEI